MEDNKSDGHVDGNGVMMTPRESRANTEESIANGTTLPVIIETDTGVVQLRRTVGLFSGVALIVGTIIGSGIFVSPKGVLIQSGTVGVALIVWVVCGFIALFGAHSFAELGTLISKAGGLYNYIQEGFGDIAGFMYLWSALLVVFPAANAAIALTFAENILQPVFPDCPKPPASVRLVAAAVIALLTYVNCISVKWSTRVQNVFMVIKILALALIIMTGVVLLCMGRTKNLEHTFDNSSVDGGQLALAFYSGLFSYSGWYTLNFLVEELKNPYKNLPRAIWISMPLVTFIYVMANVSYFVVLTPEEMIASDAVAVTFADKVYGFGAMLMPVFVACSTFGGLNGCIMSVARLFFVGAREGHLPKALALIHIKKFTPVPAVIFEGTVSVLYLFVSDVFVLINYVSFIEALSFVACIGALFKFRRTRPNAYRPIKVNLFFPAVFFLVSLFLIIVPIYSSPYDMLVGILICVSAVPVYWLAISWKNKPRAITDRVDSATCWIQKLLLSMPQEGKVE